MLVFGRGDGGCTGLCLDASGRHCAEGERDRSARGGLVLLVLLSHMRRRGMDGEQQMRLSAAESGGVCAGLSSLPICRRLEPDELPREKWMVVAPQRCRFVGERAGWRGRRGRWDGAWDCDQLSPIFIFFPSKSAARPCRLAGMEAKKSWDWSGAAPATSQRGTRSPRQSSCGFVGVATRLHPSTWKHGMVVECFDNNLSAEYQDRPMRAVSTMPSSEEGIAASARYHHSPLSLT
jgi:hypothetical protein